MKNELNMSSIPPESEDCFSEEPSQPIQKMYLSTSVFHTLNDYVQSIQAANDVVKVLLQKVVQTSFERQIVRQIPLHTLNDISVLYSQQLNTNFVYCEKHLPDTEKGGFDEDAERELDNKECWVRGLVTVGKQSERILATRENPQVKNRHIYREDHNENDTSKNNSIQEQTKKKKKMDEPAPIDLAEPLDISEEEENLRNDKEQLIKKTYEKIQAEKDKRMKEQREEQQKYEMLQKDKKNKFFTYDFDGKLLAVNFLKTYKFPPVAYPMNSALPEEKKEKETVERVKKPRGLDKKESTIRENNQLLKLKKTPDEEKDFVKFVQNNAGADNMNIQSGCTLIYEGKVKDGPKTMQFDLDLLTFPPSNQKIKMPRKDYQELTKQGSLQGNLRQSKVGTQLINQGSDKFLKDEIQTIASQYFDKKGSLQDHIEGTIKVSAQKIFETLINQIPEEEESEVILPKIGSQQKLMNKSRELKSKSAADEFNLEIQRNNNWGNKEGSGGLQPMDKLLFKKLKKK